MFSFNTFALFTVRHEFWLALAVYMQTYINWSGYDVMQSRRICIWCTRLNDKVCLLLCNLCNSFSEIILEFVLCCIVLVSGKGVTHSHLTCVISETKCLVKILRWSGGTHRISCGNNIPQILWHVNTTVPLQRNSSSITKMVCVFTLRRVTYSNACLKYCSLACHRRVCCCRVKVGRCR